MAATRWQTAISVLLLVARTRAAVWSSAFSSDMVLQRGPSRAVAFGLLSQPGERGVAVELVDERRGAVLSRTAAAVDAAAGTWRAELPPSAPEGGGSFTLRLVSGGSTDEAGMEHYWRGGAEAPERGAAPLERVTFGDVWFCAGQSNMALELQYTFGGAEAEAELRRGALDGRLRVLDYGRMDSVELASDTPQWVRAPSSPARVWRNASALAASVEAAHFAGTCFYFGLRLSQRLAELGSSSSSSSSSSSPPPPPPLGMVHCAIGGSEIEAWMSNATTATCAHTLLADLHPRVKAASLWNGMVAPFANMTIAGVAWYQGENNVLGDPGRRGYECELRALVTSWRALWRQPSLPFGIVSLSPGSDEGNPWNMARFRLAQVRVARALDRVFVAHAFDVGDPWEGDQERCAKVGCCAPPTTLRAAPWAGPGPDCLAHQDWWSRPVDGPWLTGYVPSYMGGIHPRTKQRVGDRLASGAIATAYRRGAQGPVNPQLVSAAPTQDGAAVDLVFATGRDSGPLVALAKQQRTVRSNALQLCTGNASVCECDDWFPLHLAEEGVKWVCGYPDDSNLLPPRGRLAWPPLRAADSEPNWWPYPDPSERFWHTAEDFVVVARAPGSDTQSATTTLRVTLPAGVPGPVLSVRFAWGTDQCCADDRIRNGTAPCPPLNCGLFTTLTEVPPDPFFALVAA
jgi:hypothetical protein